MLKKCVVLVRVTNLSIEIQLNKEEVICKHIYRFTKTKTKTFVKRLKQLTQKYK